MENNAAADELLLDWGYLRHAFDGAGLRSGRLGPLNTIYAMSDSLKDWSIAVDAAEG